MKSFFSFKISRRFEGLATLVTPRKSLETPVTVVVLTDCLLFLQEQNQKYTFFAPDTKAGVVSLQKLLIREKAGESKSIYIISTDTQFPEMYELKVQQPKDKTEWIKTIRYVKFALSREITSVSS